MFGNYDINEDGIIINTKTGRVLKPYDNGSGYLYVDLRINFKKKRIYVHRMLAMKFIPNPENKKYVNHIDGDKGNNLKDNLEWVTNGENMKHAYENGLSSPVRNTILNGKRNGDTVRYETTPTLRSNFKRDYGRRGISVDRFSEIYTGKKDNSGNKLYFYKAN